MSRSIRRMQRQKRLHDERKTERDAAQLRPFHAAIISLLRSEPGKHPANQEASLFSREVLSVINQPGLGWKLPEGSREVERSTPLGLPEGVDELLQQIEKPSLSAEQKLRLADAEPSAIRQFYGDTLAPGIHEKHAAKQIVVHDPMDAIEAVSGRFVILRDRDPDSMSRSRAGMTPLDPPRLMLIRGGATSTAKDTGRNALFVYGHLVDRAEAKRMNREMRQDPLFADRAKDNAEVIRAFEAEEAMLAGYNASIARARRDADLDRREKAEIGQARNERLTAMLKRAPDPTAHPVW